MEDEELLLNENGKDNGNGKKSSSFTTDLLLGAKEPPVDVLEKDRENLFSDIGKFIQNPVEEGAERNLGINLDDYSGYFEGNLGYVPDRETIDRFRAYKQSTLDQIGNAFGRIAVNIVPEIISQAANILDFEDYFNTNKEIGNWLSNWMQNVQESVNEALPIHRENPQGHFDVGDFAWWAENGSNLVKSAGAFVALGYMTGGASLAGLNRGARALRWLQGIGGGVTGQGQQALRALSSINSAVLLNQAEGVGVATQVYDEAYKQELAKLQADEANVSLSDSELDAIARETAAKKAASALNFNRLNIALNLTSAGAFLRTPMATRMLLSRGGLGKSLRRTGAEGLQEAAEEEINLISEKQALEDSYTFKDGIEDAFSIEGLESAFLGFLGGAGQTGLTQVGKHIPLTENKTYKNAYASERARLNKDRTLNNQQRDARAHEHALKVAGSSANRVSDAFLRDRRVEEQRKALERWEGLEKAEKIQDVTAAFNNAQRQSELHQELDVAINNNDTAKIEQLSDQLLIQQSTYAFETGTTEGLINLYDGYKSLTNQEAEKRGIYSKGDESDPNIYFKNRAEKALDTIKTLEKEYNKSKAYINPKQVYDNRADFISYKSRYEDVLTEVEDLIKSAEETYKDVTEIVPRDVLLGGKLDLRRAKKDFRNTPEYKKLKDYKEALNAYKYTIDVLQDRYNVITSPKYQNTIKDYLRNNKKTEEKKQAKRELKKRKTEIKKEVKNTIKAVEKEEKQKETATTFEEKPTSTEEIKKDKVVFEPIGIPAIDNTVSANLVPFLNNDQVPNEEKVKALEQFKKENQKMKTDFPLLSNQLNNLETQIDSKIKDIEEGIKETTSNSMSLETLKNLLLERLEKGDEASETLLPETMNQVIDMMNKLGINTNSFKDVLSNLEETIDKNSILTHYEKIRELYNLVINQNITKSYEEIMLSDKEKKDLVKKSKDTEKAGLPFGVYTNKDNDLREAHLSILRETAEANGVDTENKSFDFNDNNKAKNFIGNNKMAYLARDYKKIFKVKKTKDGTAYISVQKEDATTALNESLDNKVLDPSVIKEGTKLKLKPLDQITLEDGTILTKEDGVEAAPIGVFLNNELIEGLFIHTPAWINEENLDVKNVTDENGNVVLSKEELLNEDREKLRELRKKVLDQGELEIIVTSRTPGHLLTNENNSYRTITDTLPKIKIGVIKDGVSYSDRDIVEPINNNYGLSDGTIVALIPFKTTKGDFKAVPVKRLPVKDRYIASITEAIRIYLKGEENNVVKIMDDVYGINLLKFSDLKKYLQTFIYTYDSFDGTTEDFKDYISTLSDNVNLVRTTGNGIEFGRGTGINFNIISKNTIKTEKAAEIVLAKLKSHLEKTYINVDINSLNKKVNVPIIENGEVINEYENYNDFIKDNLISNYTSLELSDNTVIYSIQGTIAFEPITTKEEKSIKDTSSNKENLPITGRQFNIEDVTEEDYSPNAEDSNNNLNFESNLIPNVGINIQTSLVKTIAGGIFKKAFDLGNLENVNLEETIDSWIDYLEVPKKAYLKSNHPKKDIYLKQINGLVENAGKLKDNVRIELSKITALKETVEQEQETIGLEDIGSSLQKTSYEDGAVYSINPVTTLSTKIKGFLSFIPDKLVAETEEGTRYKDKINFLGISPIVPFDVVFNSISSVLSNNNNQYIEPTIDNYIKVLEENSISKPYFKEVIDQLKKADDDIKNAFTTVFSKHYTHHLFLLSEYDKSKKSNSLRPSFSDSRNLTNLVLTEWQNNLLGSKLVEVVDDNKIVFKSSTLEEFNSYFEKISKTKEIPKVQDVQDWLALIGVSVPRNLLNSWKTQGLQRDNVFYNLKTLFAVKSGMFNIIHKRVNKVENLDKENLYNDRAFKSIAYLSSKFRDDLYTNSHKDGKGNTIYSYSFNKYLVDRTGRLKSDIKLLEQLKEDPFSKNSLWLDDLIGERNGEYFIKKNSIFYNRFNYNTIDTYKINGEKGKSLDELTPRETEIMKVGMFMNRGNTAGGQHIARVFYPTMSDKSTMISLQIPVKTFTLDRTTKIRDADIDYLYNALIVPEIDRIKQYEENPDKVNIYEYKQGAGKFLLFPELNNLDSIWLKDDKGNKFLNPEVGELEKHKNAIKVVFRTYLNDLYFDKLDKWKNYGIIKTTNNKDELTIWDKDYKKTGKFKDQTLKEFTLNYILNNLITNMNVQQLYIGDPALYYKSKSNDPIKQAIDTNDNQGKRLAGDNAPGRDIISEPGETFTVLVAKDKEKNNKSVILDYVKDLIGDKSEAYEDIAGTDAQEFTTLEEHLKILVKGGELAPDAAMSILDRHKNEDNLLLSDLGIILKPFKPVYVNNYLRDGIMGRLYIKSASIPLIKEFTEGTPLNKLRELMESNKIDRIAFESAVKVGKPTEIVNFWQGDNIEVPENWVKSVLKVPRQGHKIQQDNPFDPSKDKINYGTQQSKLLFSNIMETTGFEDYSTGEKINGRTLYESYNSTYEQLFKEKKNKFVEEIGYNPETETINTKKLKNMLVKEAEKRGYSLNDIISLELDELNLNFEVPLWLSGNDSKISSLLNSLVDNNIRKHKTKGNSFTLMTQEGLENPKIVKVGDWDGVLKPMRPSADGKMLPAEVLIPFKFWNNNGEALSLREFIGEDGKLDLNKVDEDLLEAFGFRIPTQGLNSMSYLKVVGFLPEEYEDVLVAPRDFVAQMGSDFDFDKLYVTLYNTDYSRNLGTLRKVNENSKVKDAKIKILEDKILEIHKSVLLNPNEDVQYQRVNPLDFGKLKDLEKVFYKEEFSYKWTPLYDDYQSFKYSNARAGKIGIGAFSLDSVFNSVLQTIEDPVELLKPVKVGKGITWIPYKVNIAGKESNKLNDIKAIDGRYKSEVISAFQSASVDNEKEQLMFKLNINNNTFDAIRAMAQLGFDENIIIAVITQPAVKEYINNLQTGKRVSLPENLTGPETRLVKKTDYSLMVDYATGKKESSPEYQKAILKMFLDLSEKGKILKRVQSSINSDSAGVGKDLFYSLRKGEQILRLNSDFPITNIGKLLGDYLYYGSDEEYMNAKEAGNTKSYFDKKEKEGYFKYKGLMIKPTNINGYASVYGTLLNNQIWRRYLPYDHPKILQPIESVIRLLQNKPSSIREEAELYKSIFSAYKSFLFSNNLELFQENDNLQDLRNTILYDEENNLSLGSYILELRNEKSINNPLINKLIIGQANKAIDITGKVPTNIRYNSAATETVDEDLMRDSFIDMIKNIRELPSWNGVEMNSKKLADYLIAHQVLTGGIQKANQFVKHIPVEYLINKEYYKGIRDILNSKTELDLNSINESFLTQYIQHNPKRFYNEKIDEIVTEEGLLENSTIKDPPPEITTEQHIIISSYSGKGYRVFRQNETTSDYNEIDVLGRGDHLEYDITKPIGISNMYINRAVVDNSVLKEEIPDKENIASFLSVDRRSRKQDEPIIKEGENKLENSYELNNEDLATEEKYNFILDKIASETTDPILKYMANKLQEATPYLSNVPLVVDYNLKTKAVSINAAQTGSPVMIRINPKKIKTKEDLNAVLIEEILHSVLKRELKVSKSDPVNNIKKLYEDIKSKVIKKYGEEEFSKMEEKVKNKDPLASGIERNILYSVYNIDEFVAGIVTNKEFQNFLTTLSAQNKNMWETLLDKIVEVLKSIGVIDDNLFRNALHDVLYLVDSVTTGDYSDIETNKFIRTTNYLNEKFDLKDENGNLKPKSNSKEILDFINTNISNVEAKIINLGEGVKEFKPEDIKVANKKEEYTIKLNIGQETRSGYKIAIKGQPNIKFYVTNEHKGSRKRDWRVEELVTGHFFPLRSNMSPLLREIPETLATDITNLLKNSNNAKKILEGIGFNFEGGKGVELTPRKYNVTEDYSIGIEDALEISEKIRPYIDGLTVRLQTLQTSLTKARANNNLERINQIESLIEEEKEKLEKAKSISSLVELADRGVQDLEEVQEILDRDVTAEDILYMRNIVNFWTRAKELLFDEDDKTSEVLAELYGKVEGLAAQKEGQVHKLEKDYMNRMIKEYTGINKDVDSIFNNYQDINWISSRVRDISTSDNLLLDAIWTSVKEANIKAKEEATQLLDTLDVLLEEAMPILSKINSKDPFDIFRQRTKKGKLTGHMVSRYSSNYFKKRSKVIRPLYKEGTFDDIEDLALFYKNNTRLIDLQSIFPADNNYTEEINRTREELKKELGNNLYLDYIEKQGKKIDKYNESKKAKILNIITDFNLKDESEIESNKDALFALESWINRNSPYKMYEYSAHGVPSNLSNYKFFKNNKYYEEIPAKIDRVSEKETNYIDENFSKIENSPELLQLYNKISDIFEELKQYLPEEKRRVLAYGGIPEIEKTLFELYKEKGFKAGFAPIYDAWQKSIRSKYTEEAFGTEDPVTKKEQKNLHLTLIKDNYKEFNNELDKRISEYKIKNKEAPSDELLEEWEEDIRDQLAQRKSFDLGKIAKVYASTVLAYKHKSKIEDGLKIANNVVSSYREIQRDAKGEPITNYKTQEILKKSKEDSFKRTKEQLDNFMKVFYGEARDEELLGKKAYTSNEKQMIKELEALKEELKDQLDKEEIEKTEFDKLTAGLEIQIERLGRRKVGSRMGDNLLKYIQLKGMGWNVLAGFANTGFGFIANVIEGSGRQLYSNKDLARAYKMTFNSMLKNVTFNKFETGQAKKIRKGMDKWDVMKDASQELFTSSVPNTFAKRFKWLAPYNVNQRTEYMNQAPLLIALTQNKIISTPKGDITLWEGFDDNWNWKEEYGEEPKEEIKKVRIQLDQLIKRNHGNYDPESPLAAKRAFIGRAMSQFRSWMYEGFAVRFEKERYDAALQQTVKGRYRSIPSLFNAEGTFSSLFKLLKSLIRQLTFDKTFKNATFEDLVEKGVIKEIDAANLRRVTAEAVLYININLFMLMMGMAAEGLDDDDDRKYAYNLLINEGLRLRTDIAFYLNPMEARKLIRDLIPAVSVVKDGSDWAGAVSSLLEGQDEFETGIHAGESRTIKATSKLLPFGSQIYKTYNTSIQVFDK